VSTRTPNARPLAVPMVALSVALHGAAFAAISRVRPAPVRERIQIEVVRRETPPAPARIPPPSPPRPKVALAAPVAPPPARVPAPPPALASAPAEAPAPGAPRPLPRVGLSLGSTVSTGGFAVGVGNTVYGRASETAADPATVRPYSGGAVPAARLSAQPHPLDLPRIPYPPDARRAGVEGQVVLVLRVDVRGAVAGVRVVDAPSPALAQAAEEGARRFRFTPALLEGAPVETEIRFTYTFLLE
jgi:periplasmic protein TonB